jgi:thiol-disulfide isomerase/thioredoxin
MTGKKYFILYAACLMMALTSCQAKTYRIAGTAEGLADGEKLFLTTDLQTATPIDTIIVKDGHFSAEGNTDSVQLAMLYSAKTNEQNAAFFLEPGNISITLSATPGASRVGGTDINNMWQQLNDSVVSIGEEINRIAEHIYGGTVGEDEQQRGMAQIEQLNSRFAELVKRTAKKNIENEFGYFMLTYYPEEIIDNDTRASLIKQLPDNMRQRKAIKEMEAWLETMAKTGEGATISNFSQTTPEGNELSIMSEVSKNRITVIDFWASWCGPCRQEMPFMLQLYNNYKDRGLGIVGVSLDSSRDAWVSAIKQLKMPWPQMSDLKGWKNAVAVEFSVTSIPHTIVVDQKGKILKRGLRGDKLENFVAEKLK